MIWGPDYLGQGGGFGLAISWPGDLGGEFDVGVYGQENGSGLDVATPTLLGPLPLSPTQTFADFIQTNSIET